MPKSATEYSLLSEDKLKEFILSEYNLQDAYINQIKFKNTDKQRAVYKVDHNSKSYCLKKVYYTKEELLFVYSSIEWLYRFKLHVPRILPTKSGGRFVLFNNMLFILTPWVDGEKCDYDNPVHIIESAKTLAKIHKATENFFPIEGSNIRLGYENIYTSMNKHFHQLLTYSNLAIEYRDIFSSIFIKNFDICINLAKISNDVASQIDSNNMKKSLCHLDFVNKNIIFDKNSKVWIIDFDKCKIDYRAHDISYFLRRFLKRENTNWNLDLLVNCLYEYENILPLTIDDYKYILSYISFPQKYWKLARDYYNNIDKCNKSSFITLLDKTVRHTENQLEMIYGFKDFIKKNHRL
ncbi:MULTISPECIES: CotS family spore coat protein [Clostridium]|jgi:CotS family spore coat protein|uniref:CotS family spore coat protein n=1 Tax=Clostridium TaxID=1485 RepID=UPI0002881F6A|nr:MULTISPECIES: CotS family spore coat protein [Clostridium]MDF2502904.1 spore coat protein-like protein [Clostridium sp.]